MLHRYMQWTGGGKELSVRSPSIYILTICREGFVSKGNGGGGARLAATVVFGGVYDRAPINLPLPQHAKGALQNAVLGAWDHKFAIVDKKLS